MPFDAAMFKVLAFAASLALFAGPALAEPTHVMVRAQAQDAKFIGDHMGGVQVTLSDAHTGKVLAKGLIKGGTGDTARIVKAPRLRGAQISDAETAGFDAVVDIAEPTLVRVDAVGPIGKPASSIKVASTLWVVPGHDITGDGLVLTFPGLVVEPSSSVDADGQLRLLAKISPMCGCPIDASGLWDAANYSVHATLLLRGKTVQDVALAFTGKTGEYAAALPNPGRGQYAVRFVAADVKSLNAGVTTLQVDIEKR